MSEIDQTIITDRRKQGFSFSGMCVRTIYYGTADLCTYRKGGCLLIVVFLVASFTTGFENRRAFIKDLIQDKGKHTCRQFSSGRCIYADRLALYLFQIHKGARYSLSGENIDSTDIWWKSWKNHIVKTFYFPLSICRRILSQIR